MKRGDLVRHLREHGCEQLREGSRHSIWYNVETRVTTALPRHQEVRDHLARKICQELGVPPP